MDRETVSPFGLLTINPVAYDEGGTGLNSETTHVEIRIRDVNDNHPYIESPPVSNTFDIQNYLFIEYILFKIPNSGIE